MVTGRQGQLARALTGAAPPDWDVRWLARPDIDLLDWRAVRDAVATFQPSLIIHAAAHTDVDGCEREPETAWQVNSLATRHVAQAAARVDSELVYVSTNYVFDGTKREPYHEFDAPAPISVYGASKLAGEREAIAATTRVWVARTAMLYAREGRNFVNTMLRLMTERERLTVVEDQVGNPTLAGDLADAIVEIVDQAPYGVHHVVNTGVASWYEWAVEIARLRELTTRIDPVLASAYPRLATPPANGALRSLALPALGITLPDWRDALARSLS